MRSVETPDQCDNWIHHLLHKTGVKQHGFGPPTCPGTRLKTTPKVVKRSLIRAWKRVQQTGMTWYRGRCLTMADFDHLHLPPLPSQSSPQSPAVPAPVPKADLQRCHDLHGPRHRISCMLWNPGGLAAPRLDELRTLLDTHRIPIGVFVETRWGFSSEWSDDRFHYVHSGASGPKGQGILIMLARSLCPTSHIRWREIHPGRLLHLRLLGGDRDTDIVACYHFTFTRTQACQRARDGWWNQLDDTLRQLPTRNTLFLLGDYICCLPQSTGLVGSGAFRWKGRMHTGTQHPDQGRFMSILKQHSIATLNTWQATLGPTYEHGEAMSRIDFICARLHKADGQAKSVRYLRDAPFLDQPHSGHVPILSHLARRWVPPGNNLGTRLTAHQRQQARIAYHDQTTAWQAFAHASALGINKCLAQAGPQDPLDTMHQQVLHHFRSHFPGMSKPKPVAPWQSTRRHILNKWDHRRKMCAVKPFTLLNVFRSWFHVARFQYLKRSHRRSAYHARKIQFEDIVREASVAAEHHDMHSVFKIINSYSPKQPRKRIQLRKSDGTIATPLESAAIMTQYIRSVWAGPSEIGLQFLHSPGVPFTVSDLRYALSQIPICKATVTAPPFAPGAVWREHADILASGIHALLERWWASVDPYIPPSWKAGWLVMLPKPQKSPCHPANLRPIALQCPLGKCTMGILIGIAQKQAWSHMISWPIFAYMPARSTLESILRVASHCSRVRQLVGSQRATPHQRAMNLPKYTICGGFQIFLDINSAFDSVCRAKLFARLSQLDVDNAVLHLLTAWHEGTVYHVPTDVGESEIPIGKGLRQGCKAAPTLWNFFIILFLIELSQEIPVSWIQSHITIYADDCHIGGLYWSEVDFQRLLHMISVVFDTLQSLDMEVNPSKTIAILAMAGTSFRPFRQKVVFRDAAGEYVKIPKAEGGHMKIHLQRKAKYLGVMMSYQHFEKETLHHRVTLAHLGFSRMRGWLCGKQLGVPDDSNFGNLAFFPF